MPFLINKKVIFAALVTKAAFLLQNAAAQKTFSPIANAGESQSISLQQFEVQNDSLTQSKNLDSERNRVPRKLAYSTAEQNQWLQEHNSRRQTFYSNFPQYVSDPTGSGLQWSNCIANSAQRYADLLIGLEGCQISHTANDNNSQYTEALQGSFGENLAMNMGSSPTTPAHTPAQVLQAWYDNEIDLTNPTNPVLTYPSTSATSNHATQVIARSTSLLGCGNAEKDITTGAFAGGKCHIQVCRYIAAGNCHIEGFLGSIPSLASLLPSGCLTEYPSSTFLCSVLSDQITTCGEGTVIPDESTCPASAPVGSGGGDPHFKTFNGRSFSYHGQCDLVLMQSDMMRVHVRTTRVDQPGNLLNYSYISSAAMQLGNGVLEVSADATILVDGVPATGFDDTKESSAITFAGYPLRKTVSGGGGKWTTVILNLLDGKWVRFHCNTRLGLMHVDVEGHFPDSRGLLGAPAGVDDRLLSRDKTVDLSEDWNAFGEEWQVKDSEPRLFVDQRRAPQHPISCIYKQTSAKQSNLRRRLSELNNQMTLETAKVACARVPQGEFNQFCIEDVMATGDVDLAEDSFYHAS